MCCCEPMPQGGNALSRNPNVCASCSSMMDGMGDSNPLEALAAAEELPQDKLLSSHEPFQGWVPEDVVGSGEIKKRR